MLQWKEENRKVAISKGMLTGVVNQCKHNIDSAKSHLKEERKKEQDASHLRNLQRLEAEAGEKQRALAAALRQEKEAQEREEGERRAKRKMLRVTHLVDGWKQAEVVTRKEPEPKKKRGKGDAPPGGVDDETGIFDTDLPEGNQASALFDDDSDDDDDDDAKGGKAAVSSGGDGEGAKPAAAADDRPMQKGMHKDLFGDSSSDEDGEVPSPQKRSRDNEGGDIDNDGQAAKKRRLEALAEKR